MLCAGYEGDVCSQEIDECASNPCQNDATCNDGIGSYNCSCKLSFHNLHGHTTGYTDRKHTDHKTNSKLT